MNYIPTQPSIKRNATNPLVLSGIVLVMMSLFLSIIVIVLPLVLKKSYERYDHGLIVNKGREHTAHIISLTITENIRIFGKNPIVIEYEYYSHGRKVLDKFKTIDFAEVNKLRNGDTISIVVHQEQSVIKNMEPFRFPVYIFLTIPVMIFLIGSVLIMKGYYQSCKELPRQ